MDPDIACILDMVKEKLSAQMVAGEIKHALTNKDHGLLNP